MSEERRLVFTFSLADFGVKLELATIFVLLQVLLPGLLLSNFSHVFFY